MFRCFSTSCWLIAFFAAIVKMLRCSVHRPQLKSFRKHSLIANTRLNPTIIQNWQRTIINSTKPGSENESETSDDKDHGEKSTVFKMFESALTTFASIAILGYVPELDYTSWSSCHIFGGLAARTELIINALVV